MKEGTMNLMMEKMMKNMLTILEMMVVVIIVVIVIMMRAVKKNNNNCKSGDDGDEGYGYQNDGGNDDVYSGDEGSKVDLSGAVDGGIGCSNKGIGGDGGGGADTNGGDDPD